MPNNILFKIFIALSTIFISLAILVFIINKLKKYQFVSARNSKKTLKVIDYIYVDNATKIVLIQNANTEHLVIINKEYATLLETRKVNDEDII